jgi:hypothetical protein
MKFLLALLSLPLLAASDAPAPEAGRYACGPSEVKFSVKADAERPPLAQPEPGKAMVYVVEVYDRPLNQLGKPTIRAGMDGTWMGANRSTSYLSFAVDAGEHHLCTDWQDVPRGIAGIRPSLVKFNAEAGQTYYFQAHVVDYSTSLWSLDLQMVNEDQGRMLVETSPHSSFAVKK